VFNLSGSEIMFLLLAGLVVLGPERLPGVIRQLGRLYGELRRMASGFEREFKDTFQDPINEIKKSAQEFTDLTNDFGKVDTEPSPPMSAQRSAAPPEVIDSSVPQAEQPEAQSEDVPQIDDTGEQRS
jgi:sec-independent protein translocase protein TatB